MTLTLLLLVLAQSPDAPTRRPLGPLPVRAEAPVVEPSAAVAPPPVAESWPVDATKRFLGTLTGGLAGLAIPAAMALGAPPCVGSFCPVTVVGGLAAVIAPITVTIGTLIGHLVVSESASVGAALAGLVGGLALASALLLFHVALIPPTFSPTIAPTVPVLIGAGSIVLAFQALALQSRTEALAEAPAIEVPVSRFLLESLGTFGGVVLGGLLSLVVVAATFSPIVGVVSAVLLGSLLPLVPYGIHRSLGGRGTVASGYLGLLVSGAAGLLGFVLGGASATGLSLDPRGVVAFVGLIALGTVVTVAGIPLMLEWSHGREVLSEAREKRTVSAGLAPVIGPTGISGGAVSLGGTF